MKVDTDAINQAKSLKAKSLDLNFVNNNLFEKTAKNDNISSIIINKVIKVLLWYLKQIKVQEQVW